ncbi:hypothetical protein O7627_23945 [Solwaraspora sp. WMMD1047]|uniref:hypothetical protein n=1 Tax=Solwaraspora sp. WMMD1047 TaxID=3016102 RepID=UPI002415A283|nr:hypothetical protein [Solwaraspora sp. WMMD1047]MDG4832336.1 hypothetical protein [Solwaraspora sp. WMMD1047]
MLDLRCAGVVDDMVAVLITDVGIRSAIQQHLYGIGRRRELRREIQGRASTRAALLHWRTGCQQEPQHLGRPGTHHRPVQGGETLRVGCGHIGTRSEVRPHGLTVAVTRRIEQSAQDDRRSTKVSASVDPPSQPSRHRHTGRWTSTR